MKVMTVAAAVLLFFARAVVAAAPCAAADALLAGTHYAEAQKAYVQILKTDPAQACAREGLDKIAQLRSEVARHLDLAAAFALADDKAAARQEKLAAQAIDPSAGAPAAATAKGATDVADPFAAAKALSRARLHDAAAKELQKELTAAAPGPLAVPEELSYLTGWRIVDFALRHEIASVLLLAGAALLAWLILRWKLQPRLNVEDLVDPNKVVAGHGASLYLQQQLVALARREASTGVLFVTAPITELTIPAAISSAIPAAFGGLKTLLSVLSGVYWQKTLTLTGALHPASGSRGVGMTLVLRDRKKIHSTTTLWQDKYDSASADAGQPSASAYYDLAQPAAIWLLFQLLQFRRFDDSKIRQLMGTDSWNSYAMNAAGVRARRTKPRRAEELFVKALSEDRDNAAARANLGSILQDLNEPDRALDQLTLAKREAPKSGGTDDPVFYAASFRIALIHYERRELPEALAEVNELARVMDDTRKAAALRPAGERERLQSYIDVNCGSVEALRLGVEAERGIISPANAHAELLKYKLDPFPETQFNLACTYAVLAGVGGHEAWERTFLNDALMHLKFALHLEPAFHRLAAKDRAFDMLRQTKKTEFYAIIGAARDAIAAAAPPLPAPAATATAAAAAEAPPGRGAAAAASTSLVSGEIVGTS